MTDEQKDYELLLRQWRAQTDERFEKRRRLEITLHNKLQELEGIETLLKKMDDDNPQDP